VEVCFPVLDEKLRRRVISEGLESYLEDNTQAWEMDSGGTYRLPKPSRARKVCAQTALIARLASAGNEDEKSAGARPPKLKRKQAK
ncbi:MAG: hypothetical protein EXR36_11820, partial [Betaproteobacteria bacterium]|nr:hypothetical protein [Betaproteobacteria bacterium]